MSSLLSFNEVKMALINLDFNSTTYWQLKFWAGFCEVLGWTWSILYGNTACEDVLGRVRTSLGFTERGQEKLKSLSLPFSLPPISDLERGSCMKCINKSKCVYSCPDCKWDFTYPLLYHFPPASSHSYSLRERRCLDTPSTLAGCEVDTPGMDVFSFACVLSTPLTR